MKFQILLVLSVALFFSVSATAQLPPDFLTNKLSPFQNRRSMNIQNGSHLTKAAALSPFAGKPSENCSSAESAAAPQAPCNGISITSISFSNANRSIQSGTSNTVGVVYRYADAGIAPDGTVLDALVTVLSYSNNQDGNQTNFTDADVPSGTAGFDGNLQPNINQEATNFINVGTTWTGNITYRIQFVVKGTNTPRVITVAATTIDNDGGTVCGTTLRESVTYSTALNQVLTSSTTTQTKAGNTITGPTTNQANIGIGMDYANAALYMNVSEFTWTYSYTTAGNISGCNTTSSTSAARYGSLNLSCQITFDTQFASVAVSGRVFNDTNGLTGGIADGTGTNVGGTIYANLLDSNNFVIASVPVAADGTYTFSNVVAGSYNVQLSTNQGVESANAPVKSLPSNWVNTGENLGTGTGNDGSVNGLLSVTVGSTSVTNANFGIEQLPAANNNTAAEQTNPGGTTNATVPATTFTASDSSPGTVSSIRITAFPSNATSITINGTPYSSANFPSGGVTVPANASGNPTQTILVDPVDGAVTVAIPFVAIDNAGMTSPVNGTASVPFALAPTAAGGNISGALRFNGKSVGNVLVVLTDVNSGAKAVTRTDAEGNYFFTDKEVGRAYIIQPLSGKYSFNPSTSVVNLLDNAVGMDFRLSAKKYHPKNDFDGDGKSDIAVYRPAEGNWYVLKSSDGRTDIFNFGAATDVPVSADFDGDGRTDYAVFRPAEGNWYIWQSKTQDLRVENFGAADDKLLPADYDGDGKADIAVYRGGDWFVLRSSDGKFEAKRFGANSDAPFAEDFDGDGKADFAVFRPAEEIWYFRHSSTDGFAAVKFGLSTDVPAVADFDGDGFADIAQFRNGFWYALNSTTGFEGGRLEEGKGKTVVGDFDGDGRAEPAVFLRGIWSVRAFGDGTVRNVSFGLTSDVIVR